MSDPAKLLIDIGNTRTKWVLAQGGEFIDRGSVLNAELPSYKFDLSESVESVCACCVASDQYFEKVHRKIELQFGLSIDRVGVDKVRDGMVNRYQTLDRLGADRWIAAIGARQIEPQGPLIVIDAGTAVTIDLVSNTNHFKGGVILPGGLMMHDALVGRTAGILSVPLQVDSVIGRSTEECVNAGVLYGLVGGIERVVKEMQLSLTHGKTEQGRMIAEVLICGGDAEQLLPLLPATYRYQPDTIFRGLLAVSEQP